ncbi:beta-1,6-N-acetylglucosaminyltransferase [Heyndrickxia ginsengihumi]|uniref:beta-1,6-N-acetylglucosaminyltransferase n=1 Tax=Heyndrickxia ginsengihumi TaxID=363870 RepID=UPI003D1C592D
MNRHAYLIIAHNHFEQLGVLVRMLDDIRNDIFLHIDKKVKNFDFDNLRSKVKYSNVYLVDNPVHVSWGGFSQIKSELLLLKKSTQINSYSYYHLLSGQDLPIKTQDQIHDFFDKNQGKEFVRFESDKFLYEDRLEYYHFFPDIIGRPDSIFKKIISKFNSFLVYIQKLLRVSRIRGYSNEYFQKGTNWFSITDDLARYILSKEKWIYKTFKYSFCCDEVFLQTLINNSLFKEKLYRKDYDNSCDAMARLIDWNRGKPYIFSIGDLEELKNSKLMFARKFDDSIDKKIILRIEEMILSGSKSSEFGVAPKI